MKLRCKLFGHKWIARPNPLHNSHKIKCKRCNDLPYFEKGEKYKIVWNSGAEDKHHFRVYINRMPSERAIRNEGWQSFTPSEEGMEVGLQGARR